MDYKDDIPQSEALAAARGTYSQPERVAESSLRDYASTLQSDFETLQKLTTTQEKVDILDDEFARYRAGYRDRTLAYLGANSRCVSWFIAGPSNYPARSQEKKRNTADKRLRELIEYRERALKAIRRKLTPELQPVKSSDSDAVSRLKAKIEKAEKDQALYKAVNKIVKAKPKNEKTDEKIKQLEELGLKTALKVFEKDFIGRVGIPSYKLTNNNANIRRMKHRVEKVIRDQSTPDATAEGSAARLEDCPADNRVRLFFPGKPDAEVRTRLKRSGFRWARSLGCWQAYRNAWTLQTARKEAGIEGGV